MKPVPIAEIKPRLPQLGRLRAGAQIPTRSGKMRPSSSDTWIITSSRPEALERLSEDYGGTVEVWGQTKSDDTHILETETETLTVLLHAEPMQEPRYELWDGGGMRRRCDGTTLTGFPKDGSEPREVPCICAQIDRPFECKPKSHLNVVLPQVTIGVWRLVTSSMNALRELQASIDVIQMASEVGMPAAELKLDRRSGNGKNYTVPVLTSRHSLGELLGAQGSSPVLEVPAGAVVMPALDAGGDFE